MTHRHTGRRWLAEAALTTVAITAPVTAVAPAAVSATVHIDLSGHGGVGSAQAVPPPAPVPPHGCDNNDCGSGGTGTCGGTGGGCGNNGGTCDNDDTSGTCDGNDNGNGGTGGGPGTASGFIGYAAALHHIPLSWSLTERAGAPE
ncbi:hypothetical protein [Nocardia stercoris]|uniref:hypothetical protein n=1 Tax=Nocardia stercoris TaxID=2483361 RepID=UPI00131A34A0|nr:hypothetical protein [Nocardia stercoris]